MMIVYFLVRHDALLRMNHSISLMIVINSSMNEPLLDTARVFFKSLFDSNVVVRTMRLSVVMDRDTHELL